MQEAIFTSSMEELNAKTKFERSSVYSTPSSFLNPGYRGVNSCLG